MWHQGFVSKLLFVTSAILFQLREETGSALHAQFTARQRRAVIRDVTKCRASASGAAGGCHDVIRKTPDPIFQ